MALRAVQTSLACRFGGDRFKGSSALLGDTGLSARRCKEPIPVFRLRVGVVARSLEVGRSRSLCGRGGVVSRLIVRT